MELLLIVSFFLYFLFHLNFTLIQCNVMKHETFNESINILVFVTLRPYKIIVEVHVILARAPPGLSVNKMPS